MPYRAPDPTRIANQITDHHLPHLGQPATWRQWVSASTGAYPAVAGFDATPHYREQTITGIFRPLNPTQSEGETQTPAGLVAAARMVALTTHPFDLRDELIIAGATWRIDSDSQPAPLAALYLTHLRLGI